VLSINTSRFGRNIRLKAEISNFKILDEQLKFNCSKLSKPDRTYQLFMKLLNLIEFTKYLLSLDKEHAFSLLLSKLEASKLKK
jgi:hypothetical protein